MDFKGSLNSLTSQIWSQYMTLMVLGSFHRKNHYCFNFQVPLEISLTISKVGFPRQSRGTAGCISFTSLQHSILSVPGMLTPNVITVLDNVWGCVFIVNSQVFWVVFNHLLLYFKQLFTFVFCTQCWISNVNKIEQMKALEYNTFLKNMSEAAVGAW